jgi:hypothetical protein
MASVNNHTSDSSDYDEFMGPEGLEQNGELFAAITGYNFEPVRQSRGSTVRECGINDSVDRLGNTNWLVDKS